LARISRTLMIGKVRRGVSLRRGIIQASRFT
jgi:hypothetical protein